MSISAGSRSLRRVTFRRAASGLGSGWVGIRGCQDYSLMLTSHTTSQPVWRPWCDHLLKGGITPQCTEKKFC
jgi:hypothetical protein